MSRKLPPIDPTKESIVEKALESPKPANIPEPSTLDLSIDEMLKSGLKQIYKLLRVISDDITSRTFTRETVQNLKDCMTMLHDLKQKEDEVLDTLSQEDLEKIVKE